MDKDTRVFIWGFILLFIGAFAFVIRFIECEATGFDTWDYVLLALHLYITFIGYDKIRSVI